VLSESKYDLLCISQHSLHQWRKHVFCVCLKMTVDKREVYRSDWIRLRLRVYSGWVLWIVIIRKRHQRPCLREMAVKQYAESPLLSVSINDGYAKYMKALLFSLTLTDGCKYIHLGNNIILFSERWGTTVFRRHYFQWLWNKCELNSIIAFLWDLAVERKGIIVYIEYQSVCPFVGIG
jgi:hypothetical protein